MGKNWDPNGTGHQRCYGLFQSDSDPVSWGEETCVAVFSTRVSAEAFKTLQEEERDAEVARYYEQFIRELYPYEEYATPHPTRKWEVRSLALNPTNTAEIYTS